MIEVQILDYTRYALELLVFTKGQRLSSEPTSYTDICNDMTYADKVKVLDYMLGTNPGSWEFVTYTFHISGITRALTHQFVRTRTGSFAQQSQRTVDMSDFEYTEPAVYKDDKRQSSRFETSMKLTKAAYTSLIEAGSNPQDARSVLPEATCTNITAKFNLRTLSEMAKVRLCYRTQGEYQKVFRLMRDQVLDIHPWADKFIRVHCASTGVCCYPHFKECPIKPGVFNPDTGLIWPALHYKDDAFTSRERKQYNRRHTYPVQPLTKVEIQDRWERTKFEAIPQEDK